MAAPTTTRPVGVTFTFNGQNLTGTCTDICYGAVKSYRVECFIDSRPCILILTDDHNVQVAS